MGHLSDSPWVESCLWIPVEFSLLGAVNFSLPGAVNLTGLRLSLFGKNAGSSPTSNGTSACPVQTIFELRVRNLDPVKDPMLAAVAQSHPFWTVRISNFASCLVISPKLG